MANLQSVHVVSRQSRLSVHRVPLLVKLLIRAPVMCEFGVVTIICIISQQCNSGVNEAEEVSEAKEGERNGAGYASSSTHWTKGSFSTLCIRSQARVLMLMLMCV